MQIDVRLSGQMVGAWPPPVTYCPTTNPESSSLTRPILL